MCIVFFVFFFKQKTAYEMRISDWSSDVCSSDLLQIAALQLIEMNREKDEQIARLGPKAEFYDQFASSDGLYGIQNAARVLNEPPNKFSRRLKDEGYLFYQGGDRKSTRLNSSH